MTFSGEGPWIRRNASGSGSWRGLSLGSSGATFYATGDRAQIYDVLFVGTDGIRGVGNVTFGGITVPDGSYGRVPTGMAGLWRFTAQDDFENPDDPNNFYDFAIVINDHDIFWEDDLDTTTTGSTPYDWNLALVPIVYPLEEGDVIWCYQYNGSGVSVGGPDATFLMEYLGPVPVEAS